MGPIVDLIYPYLVVGWYLIYCNCQPSIRKMKGLAVDVIFLFWIRIESFAYCKYLKCLISQKEGKKALDPYYCIQGKKKIFSFLTSICQNLFGINTLMRQIYIDSYLFYLIGCVVSSRFSQKFICKIKEKEKMLVLSMCSK